MKHIIVGTNRPGSNSLKIAQEVKNVYAKLGEDVGLIDLADMPWQSLDGAQYQGEKPAKIAEAVATVENSDGLIFVIPEYNGSYPGALKYFVDHWSYPDAFEARPCCFIGLGWMWGGLRPVEHFQQVMGYRNAYQLPNRVFIQNIGMQFEESGELKEEVVGRLSQQASVFQKFVAGLSAQEIDANSVLKAKKNAE